MQYWWIPDLQVCVCVCVRVRDDMNSLVQWNEWEPWKRRFWRRLSVYVFFINLVQLFYIGWEPCFFALLSVVVYRYYSFQTKFVLVIAVVLMSMFVVQGHSPCNCTKTAEGCAINIKEHYVTPYTSFDPPQYCCCRAELLVKVSRYNILL